VSQGLYTLENYDARICEGCKELRSVFFEQMCRLKHVLLPTASPFSWTHNTKKFIHELSSVSNFFHGYETKLSTSNVVTFTKSSTVSTNVVNSTRRRKNKFIGRHRTAVDITWVPLAVKGFNCRLSLVG
jgi:hypothetical protein